MNSPTHSPAENIRPDSRSLLRNALLGASLFTGACEGDTKGTNRVDIPETVESMPTVEEGKAEAKSKAPKRKRRKRPRKRQKADAFADLPPPPGTDKSPKDDQDK